MRDGVSMNFSTYGHYIRIERNIHISSVTLLSLSLNVQAWFVVIGTFRCFGFGFGFGAIRLQVVPDKLWQ
jgi:hypothetical protein